MAPARVEMYTTMTCASCVRAKRLLKSKGIDVEEIDVSWDRTPMIERTNGRMTVPQIFIDDRGIGGFDELAHLERKGELDALLGIVSS